jgi:hypothetical protein
MLHPFTRAMRNILQVWCMRATRMRANIEILELFLVVV